MRNYRRYLGSPKDFFKGVLFLTAKWWPDELYLKTYYKLTTGKTLDLRHPKTFNEKLNWLKIHNQNPLYNILADKYKVKDFVRKAIGDKYVVHNYGCWNSFDDINFEELPNSFVIKTTHDSGGVYVCKDKSNIDVENLRLRYNKAIKRNYYYRLREWVYKDADPKIIADELLDDSRGRELIDYKFWCFNGEPKVMYITNKGANIKENFYDMDFKPLDINHGFARTTPEYDMPACFDEMKSLAKKLSQNIPFVRVDFFYVNGNVYFGEFTFYDWAGLRPFNGDEWDYKLGSWIDLSKL